MINQPILKSAFKYLIVIYRLKSVETPQEYLIDLLFQGE